ncbi:hypothetical protein GBF38_011480 [Nibea albiflora]|uniref:Uncharacterized protein n=1 Tax=Nibea albiflora TaxID=240163 RepID=A0ACB7F464_NIBAL|nr:hypothetical protein GBF38_011480 [Nibea albiflora]
MDIDFILEEVLHMRPSSFSDKERLRYRAEAWSSARCLCVNQLEKEVREELQNEERLSLQFRRKVTVRWRGGVTPSPSHSHSLFFSFLSFYSVKVTMEGLKMFLSVICPKAQQDVQALFHQLSKKLLDTITSSRTGRRTKLALFAELQRTTAPLVPWVVKTALEFLLHKPEALVEVRTSQTAGAGSNSGSSLASALKSRAKAASAQIGKQLADTLGTCPSLSRTWTEARLLSICTAVAYDIVKVIYKRFFVRSKTFHMMHFDESFVIRLDVICAIQDMDNRARRAANRRTPSQDKKDCTAPEACSVVAAENSDEMKDKEKQGVFHFFSRMWKMMMRVSTEE